MRIRIKFLLFFFNFLLSGICLFADDGLIISGKITNEEGNPLSLVNVFEVGVNNQVQTNKNGVYSISIQHKAAIIRFSYSGYEMKEIKVMNSGNRDIVMKQAVKAAIPQNKPITDYTNGTESASQHGAEFSENRFQYPASVPAGGFSVNVDGTSYSNIYRYGQNAELPFEKLVRIEELINYFQYDYPKPEQHDEVPFTITTEVGICPWNKQNKLLLVGLQGKEIPAEQLPASNLVFLIDASGSMNDPVKLPLVKASMKLLTQQLRSQDMVSVVAYAGKAGINLPPTPGNKKATIEKAIDALEPGGYTAGAAGIKAAYRIAKQHFIKGGNNRIILCTDGDFNVGITSNEAIDSLIEAERKSGVLLSVLGFGNGNRQMAKMKRWAEIGNGNHNFINNLNEAKRLFVNEFASTLFSIANNVKPLVYFNPSKVQAYRLIGYDTKSSVKNNTRDVLFEEGELGSGHTVTALFEIVPTGLKSTWVDTSITNKLPKQLPGMPTAATDLATVEVSYKLPDAEALEKLTAQVKDVTKTVETSSENFRFASAVAELGLLLRDSDYKQKASYKDVISMAKSAIGKTGTYERTEFVTLAENLRRVARLMGRER